MLDMIREYRDADWSQVAAIYDLSKPDELKGIVAPDDIIPLAQDGGMLRYFFESQILVYEDQGIIQGFIGRKKEVVSWLFVHPDHRRKGIARCLLNKLLEIWPGPLKLNAAKSNQIAIALYASLGFEVVEEFEGSMYEKVIPVVRMRLLV